MALTRLQLTKWLIDSPQIQGPLIKITTEMVTKMKKGKAAGPSGINIEMLLVGVKIYYLLSPTL